jgi:hypothetical protein
MHPRERPSVRCSRVTAIGPAPPKAQVDVGIRGRLYALDRERVAHLRLEHLDHGVPDPVGVARTRHLLLAAQGCLESRDVLSRGAHREGERQGHEQRQDHHGQ